MASAAAILCLGGAAVGHAAAASAELLKVRLGGDAQQTRIVIDLDRSTTAKVVSDGAADRRVSVVLHGVTASAGMQGAGQGLVQAWMVDQVGSPGTELEFAL